MPIDRPNLRRLLIKHEGIRLKPYMDSVGKITIGVGRNLDDCGISQFEAMQMLTNDMERCCKEAVQVFSFFQSLSVVRQDVILSMLFNMGLPKLMGFQRMIEAIVNGNFERAAQEMQTSKWAEQVGERAVVLASMMRRNEYPVGLSD